MQGNYFGNLINSKIKDIVDNSTELYNSSQLKFNEYWTSSSELKKQSLDFKPNDFLPDSIQKISAMAIETEKQLDELNSLTNTPKLKVFHEHLLQYHKNLELRVKQLDIFLFLLNARQNPDFMKEYAKRIEGMEKMAIPMDKLNERINPIIIHKFLSKESEYLFEYQEYTNRMKKEVTSTMDQFKIIKLRNKLKVLNARVVTILEMFPQACLVSFDDLFSIPSNHNRWNWLMNNFVAYRVYGTQQQIRGSFDKMKDGLNIVNASMGILDENKDFTSFENKDWNKFWSTTGKMLKVAMFKDQARDQAESVFATGDDKLAKQIWNLPDNKMLKRFIGVAIPSIKYSEAIFIPRTYQKLLLSSGKEQKFCLPVISDMVTYGEQLFVKRPYQQKLRLRINSPVTLYKRYEIQPKQPQNSFFSGITNTMNTFNKIVDSGKIPDRVIYHIHGGGFISMSTFFHQTYTRLWSNNIGVPIVSVQYGKAPERPFPMGLYDCFEGYIWTLYCFKQIFKVDPQKIILVGDSAGGNLVAALTNLLIIHNIRLPDGLVLVYPALNLDYYSYTPSYLNSLEDMILPHTFLKVCLNAYLSKDLSKAKGNHLISPILSPDQVLTQYPPTQIFVGTTDPVHDDCLRLLEKLNILNPGKAHLTLLRDYPHGFLQFSNEAQPHPESKQAIKEVELALKKLLYN